MKSVFAFAALAGWILISFSSPLSSRVEVQARAAAAPVFDAATIKPARPGQNGGSVSTLPRSGRLYVQNYTLPLLVRTAYQVRLEDVVGGPDWRERDRFDIEAKAEQPVDNEQALFLMLRSLLADRFKFTFHFETREVPMYALVSSRNVPKLRKVADAAKAEAPRNSPGGGGRGGATCGPGVGARFGSLQLSGDASGARQVSGSASMPELAGFLSTLLRCRTVLDQTNTEGVFEVNLQWRQTPPSEFYVPDGSPDPELLSEMQSQLGLRLESRKGAGEVLVIDHAESPSEN
jgi:uncharacterized protein (TIGR03435 family)